MKVEMDIMKEAELIAMLIMDLIWYDEIKAEEWAIKPLYTCKPYGICEPYLF